MKQKTVAALLVAAGRGERVGRGDGPKQYRHIGGRPVLWHTIRAFAAVAHIQRLVLVIHPNDEERARLALSDFDGHIDLVFGGATRQASVRAGLVSMRADPPDIVLIHDAVRPFVAPALIEAVIDAVSDTVGIIPAIAVSDTLKRADTDGSVQHTVDRASLFAAQTPQGFAFGPMLAAHDRASGETGQTFTDDASIAEWAGMIVRLVPGSTDNVKLTLPRDLVLADEKLRGAFSMIDVRTGNGYDVHQLVPGDHVTLCGVRIDNEMALLGHSDADVGLHALTDALLATCGAGDIGVHFPPSDPQWKGAASEIFVRHAVRIVRERGGRICNVDITLICEAPKIAPHRAAMVEAICDMTGLEAERVSVKATTNETIGFVGRREGIAALATASVVFGN